MSSRIFPVLLLFTVLVLDFGAFASEHSAAAFQKVKSLAGTWEGKDAAGMAAKSKFEVVVNGTTVLETLSMSGMEDMLSVYSVDGDSVVLVHYGPTNTQPRIKALPPTAEIHQLDFLFRDAGNLPVPTTGHQQKISLHFDDADHLTESLTWRSNGKDSVEVLHLTRTKP
jgi:hypothetical protein